MGFYAVVGLLCLFFGSLFMLFVSQDPGYVLISVGGMNLEFNFWFGLTVLVIVFFLFRFVKKLLVKTYDTLAGSVSWLSESRGKKAQRRTHSGLIHFVEGNWLAAKKDLLSAAKESDQPLVHYLAAARSAHELGQIEETHFLLHQAEKVAPSNELAIALSQARIQISDKKYEQCLATLMRVKPQAGKHPVVLDLLRQVYIYLKDWKALVALLPEIKNTGLYSESNLQELEVNTYLSLMKQEASHQQDGLQKIETVWNGLSKNLKKNSLIVGFYCGALHDLEQDEKAELVLRKAIKQHWSDALVELYGHLNVEDKKGQLSVAEGWLKDHKEDAGLLVTLGRICLRKELWGKARDYFEKSLSIKEKPEVYAALGALMAQLGDHEKSTSLYQKGLMVRATNS